MTSQAADFKELVQQLEKWIADFDIMISDAQRGIEAAVQRGDSTTFSLRMVDYMYARNLRQKHIDAWEQITDRQWSGKGLR